MGKSKTVTKITEVITQAAPELQFVAAYNADDPQLTGSMKLYGNRSFVYVLTLQLRHREACIYVGETSAQYGRFLQHRMNYVFDRVYLYECKPKVLRMCEAAVIRRLMPLFNKNHNPLYFRYNRVLGIDDNLTNDREAVVRYLELWDDYCATGLYGFALPPAIYRLIKAEATDHKVTVSEELTSILEALFAEDIPAELEERTPEEGRTNLVTTMEYAMIHGKSQEQIKQYLHQSGRLTGRKFGRDWVIVDDEKLPQDRRKREVLT